MNDNVRKVNKKISTKTLDKSVKIKDISFVDKPNSDYFNVRKDDIISILENSDLSKELLIFYRVLLTNFNENDLNTFYHNIRSLKIDEFSGNVSKSKNVAFETLAFYKFIVNTIYIKDKNKIDTLYHELFHMSTAKREKNVLFTGFRTVDVNNNIGFGEGINEGYTQILAERYFDNSTKGNYNIFVYIMLLVERIVGKEKMQSLYMQSSLYGLIDELKKYASFEDISRFITYTDYLIRNIYTKNNSDKKVAIMGEMCKYINMFIVNTCINKWKLNPPQTDEEYHIMGKEIEYFLNSTLTVIYNSNKSVNCSIIDNEDFMMKIVDDLDELDIDLNFSKEKKLV